MGITLVLFLHFAAVASQRSRIALTKLVPRNAEEVEADDVVLEPNNLIEQSKDDSKCTKAGYSSHDIRQDEYDLKSWRDGNPYSYSVRSGVTNKIKPCKSASSNARGIYTSHLVPCTFQFFQIPKEQPDDLPFFVMSTACFDTSPMQNQPPFEDYIVRWPDECLTDFVRCYSLKRDEYILLRHMCAKKEPFKFPEGATHVSVNCTEDQKEKQEQIKKWEADRKEDNHEDFYLKQHNETLKQHRQSQRELHMVLFGALAICLMACCFGFCFTYRYVVKPYLTATLKRSRSDSELSSLKANADDSEKGK